jgi:hypothetical protein
MTADTYSLELAKFVLAISMVMDKDDRGESAVKITSQAGADESEDVHSMVLTHGLYFPGAQASQFINPSPT